MSSRVDVLRQELESAEAVLRSRKIKPVIISKSNAKFRRFQKTYVNDPLAFCHDCFNLPWDWAPYQDEIIGEMLTRSRQALYGPRGLGKTTVAAGLVWWAVLTSDDCKVPTTASVWRQLEKFLWPEIHKMSKKLNWDIIGRAPLQPNRELKTFSIEIDGSKTKTAFAMASNDEDKIEGVHADHRVFIIIDEAKAVKDAVFDSLEGSFSQCEQALELALSTPGPMMGRFYDICSGGPAWSTKYGYEDWYVKPVSLDEMIAAGRIDPARAEQRRKQWGENSAIYRNHILGQFAQDSELTVIKLEWVEAAMDRWETLHDADAFGPIDTVGMDIARGGGDKTIFALKSGNAIISIQEMDMHDTMPIADHADKILERNPLAKAIIDVIGVGAGVFDRLRQLSRHVLAFNASEKATGTDRSEQLTFKNKRAQSWWLMREALDPAYGSEIALPPDDALKGELTTPQYDEKSGIVVVQSKAELRKQLGRSTDKADAVIMAVVGNDTCLDYDVEVLSYAEYVASLGQGEYEYA